ncbi:flagellar hook-associated protein FlgK [Paenibacillus sp. FSL M7-1455]|jgi:flagellar hook-associated protein 1 FlgK|uniref:flagellar hook-associated protein FlgK n=1 Tax=Paenibacillus sp. FSL M7-1455 TaxID=2975316 RepID=UPI0030F99B1D
MTSTFHSIEVGKRGILAQQTALNTTGQNVTNANTPGYSRQTVHLEASRPLFYPGLLMSTAPGQLGMGVEATSITRVRDLLLDVQYRNQNTDQATWAVKQETLSNIEGIINEPSEDSIATSISEFWNAWQQLSKNPSATDLSARTVVQQKAIALTETFNHIASQLSMLKDNITEKINVKVNEANNYITQISDLSLMIARIEGLGDNANDLRDKRDLLVDQLSKLGNVQVTETDDNYQVIFGTTAVVDGQTSTQITAADAANLTKGEIAGYFQSRDVHVAEYAKQLDIMANTLATGKVEVTLPAGSMIPPGVTIPNAQFDPNVPGKLAADVKYTVDGLNGLHKLGYTLADPATPGKDFFVTSDNSNAFTAANIRVNSDILADLKNIAASMRTETVTANGVTQTKVLQGNGDLALLIAGLAEKKFNFNPNNNNGALSAEGTFGGYLQSVIAQLGTDTDHAAKMMDNGTLLVQHADNLRQSVSSVSLDEEMSDLIKFQHAYSASSRIITSMDEMLDKLINGTGIVGR